MRVRITQRPEKGDIDGVPVDRFIPGEIYDMTSSTATYLVVMGCAEAVVATSPARVVPPKAETKTPSNK